MFLYILGSIRPYSLVEPQSDGPLSVQDLCPLRCGGKTIDVNIVGAVYIFSTHGILLKIIIRIMPHEYLGLPVYNQDVKITDRPLSLPVEHLPVSESEKDFDAIINGLNIRVARPMNDPSEPYEVLLGPYATISIAGSVDPEQVFKFACAEASKYPQSIDTAAEDALFGAVQDFIVQLERS